MRKTICIALAGIVLLLFSPLPGEAGGQHGSYGGGVWVGPGPGPWGWGPHYGWGPRIYLGVPYPYPYPYYAPYYAAPPVVVQESSPVYVQPAPQPEEPSYWYYCQNPQGYYPYVKQCPNGWMRVTPSPTPSGP
jgi:hypothetical protein